MTNDISGWCEMIQTPEKVLSFLFLFLGYK